MHATGRRVNTPTVLQYEAVECGAASLKIVLGYYGKVMPLAELRERCGISRDGVTAVQLKQVAQELGLQVRAYRCSADHLAAHGRFPCILFWTFNHFLVLEGFDKGRAYLSDPAQGRRSVPWDAFVSSFTGVVLEFEPGETFAKGGEDPSPYRWLPRLLSPYRNLLPWIALVSVVAALPELFIAGATSTFIDSVLQQGRATIALPTIWISAIAVGTLLALLHAQKLLLRQLGDLLLKRTSTLLYVSLFSLPYRYFMQRMRGELAARLMLPLTLVRLGISGVIDILLALGTGLLALIVGLLISPLLILITVAVAGGNSALTLWLRHQRQNDNDHSTLAQARATGIAFYAMQGIESIKASGLENEAFGQWAASFSEALAGLQSQAMAAALPGLFGNVSSFVLRCGVVLVGGLLIIRGQLTLGELTAFQVLVGMIQTPMQQLSLFSSQLQQLDGQIGRLNDVINTEVDPAVRSFALSAERSHRVGPPPRQLCGDLALVNLGYRFSTTTPLLFDGLALHVPAGSHLAIVGGSGSGKSTLLRLLAGLFRPSQGAILYDGRDWLAWDDATLRASIALVSQDVFVFPASLEDNLTLWDPRYSSGDVLKALSEAGLLDELGGAAALGRQLSEGGSNLSGGQRQRVEIARALLRQPRLLLLDEATSALDAQRERQILAAIRRTPCTVVTVAHRLQSAQISDWVLVLEQGQLIEQGHPSDLAGAGGAYSRLLQAERVDSEGERGR